ncbi:MAG: hypothetical protein GX681_03895 [Clostridiaceae bacterium]|nr:hypothetical protein [Clostridiaceae bacterium]
MKQISEIVEAMDYLDEDLFIDWLGEIEDFFQPVAINDIGRLDNSAYDYLLSLNKANLTFSSEEIDSLIENEDANFLEIIISRDKLLASVHFWQYPQGSKWQVLNISEKPYLSEHQPLQDKFMAFAEKMNLLVLRDADLREQVPHEGEMVSIYYKYFDDEYESRQEIPY